MKTIKSPCPECGETDTGTYLWSGDDSPRPGDYSVCLNCSTAAVLDENMRKRRLTVDELIALDRYSREGIMNQQYQARLAREKRGSSR